MDNDVQHLGYITCGGVSSPDTDDRPEEDPTPTKHI